LNPRDPIGYADGMSLYEYCKSNSLNRVDPLGLRTPAPIGGSPSEPDISDHRRPSLGGAGPQVNNTEWFDSNYSNLVDATEKKLIEDINYLLLLECRKGLNLKWTKYIRNKNQETANGDADQGDWSRDKVLGKFAFETRRLYVHRMTPLGDGKFKIEWIVDMIITAQLGLEANNKVIIDNGGEDSMIGGYLLWRYPSRGVTRARWYVEGETICCKPGITPRKHVIEYGKNAPDGNTGGGDTSGSEESTDSGVEGWDITNPFDLE